MIKKFYLFNAHNSRSSSKLSTILNSLKAIFTIKIKFLWMDGVLFRTIENRKKRLLRLKTFQLLTDKNN
jgi:hypothetical protein